MTDPNLITLAQLRASMEKVESTKQDKLTFDSEPTANSTNPVTSGGVMAALDQKSQVQIITWEEGD